LNWERVDGQLPDQAEVRETELVIRSITAADEGTYRCTVRNVPGEVSRQFTVVVQGQRHFYALGKFADNGIMSPTFKCNMFLKM